ncbi:tripartite-type tricarboxylate transporter receptor subunit TctC [Ancylobacter sp. 3268]|uniref:Bug family tripartite tricarboxylate transporter substrate binding protein n=1 Tax=Ancylobacter sp. 3268 TaxID=2817752 RepID=UPI00285FB9A4|nr:tripartite tricarboxylate transporter substrate binding protein [Ancylobacter sp. 3268]MDR6951556.1 tripartite-type tricarboxylate transporter receptor subunit TctC [Ancylobacter sp. 3268]
MKFSTLAAACLSLAVASPAFADTAYPTKAVTIVVPFSAGGTADIIARMAAEHLQKKFGQPFVVENIGGGGGVSGVEKVVRSAPDGSTLVLASTSNLAVHPTLYGEKFPYQTLRDLKPISQVSVVPNVLVINPDKIPARSVPDLIAYLKANPDKVSFGSAGTGTTQHLAGELFMQKTGTQMVHIPYKGSSAMLPDLLAGNVELAFDNVPLLLPHVKSGKLVALAVATPERQDFDKNLPAVAEFVPGFEATAWHGFLAPAGTPDDVTNKLSTEIQAFMKQPETIKKMQELGITPVSSTPEQFTDLIKSMTAQWKEVIVTGNIKPQ